jgi:hypothetical protein
LILKRLTLASMIICCIAILLINRCIDLMGNQQSVVWATCKRVGDCRLTGCFILFRHKYVPPQYPRLICIVSSPDGKDIPSFQNARLTALSHFHCLSSVARIRVTIPTSQRRRKLQQALTPGRGVCRGVVLRHFVDW